MSASHPVQSTAGHLAAYGEQTVPTLAGQLRAEYGRGFSVRNLCYMLRFAEIFPTEETVSETIVQALSVLTRSLTTRQIVNNDGRV